MLLFFLMVSSRHVSFCSWLHCFSAELLILLPCNNESYLLQIQKKACFLSFPLTFPDFQNILALSTSVLDQNFGILRL